jgi:hypothetical protein
VATEKLITEAREISIAVPMGHPIGTLSACQLGDTYQWLAGLSRTKITAVELLSCGLSLHGQRAGPTLLRHRVAPCRAQLTEINKAFIDMVAASAALLPTCIANS